MVRGKGVQFAGLHVGSWLHDLCCIEFRAPESSVGQLGREVWVARRNDRYSFSFLATAFLLWLGKPRTVSYTDSLEAMS